MAATNIKYEVKLEDIDKSQFEWIEKFSQNYSDCIRYTIEDGYEDTFSITYGAQEPQILRDIVAYVIDKLYLSKHFIGCLKNSSGFRYSIASLGRKFQLFSQKFRGRG